MKNNSPYHLMTGTGHGFSYSSLAQVGDIMPVTPLGQANVGLYCNLANGNLVVVDQSLPFIEINGNLNLRYIYNKNVDKTSDTWRLSIPAIQSLPSDKTAPLILTEIDGHQTTYTYDSNNNIYIAPGLADGTPYFYFNDQNNYWVRYHPGTHVNEIYNLKGHLIERRDQQANITFFNYDDSGRLTQIKAPSGDSYHVSYVTDEQTHHTKISITQIDSSFTECLWQTYDFDALGRLVSSTRSNDGEHPKGYTTTYTYQGTSSDVNAQENKTVETITQADGTSVKFFYDSQHRFSFIALGDGSHQCRFSYPATDKVHVAFNSGCEFDVAVDSDHKLASLTKYTGYQTDAKEKDTTTYTYADAGQLASKTYPNSATETFEHNNAYGLLTKHQQPNGQTTQYSYEMGSDRPYLATKAQTLNNSTLVTRYVHEHDLAKSVAPEDERVYLRYKISPKGCVSAYVPDSRGNIKSERTYTLASYQNSELKPNQVPSLEEMNNWTAKQDASQSTLVEHEYDLRGLPIKTTHYAALDKEGNGTEDAANGLIKMAWNDFGQSLTHNKQVDGSLNQPDLATTTQTYDEMQRHLSHLDPLNNKTTFEYSPDSEEKSAPYQKTTNRPNGRIEAEYLDQSGCCVKKLFTANTIAGKTQQRNTLYTLDLANHPTIIQRPDGQLIYKFYDKQDRLGLTVNAKGYVTQYCYDRQHNSHGEIRYTNPVDMSKIGKEPNGDLVLYYLKKDNQHDRYHYTFYDQSHREYARVDEKGYLTLYTYDPLDRLIQQVAYADAASTDELSQLKQGKTISRSVDLTKDRCTNHYYDQDNLKIGSIDPDGWVSAWQYDNAKRLRQKIQYATQVTNNRDNDFTTIVPKETVEDAHTYHFYDARGNCILTVDPEGYITTFNYYPNAKLKTKTHYDTQVDSSWYDDTTQIPALPKSNPEDRVYQYVYDKLERVVDQYDEQGLGQKKQYDTMGQLTLKQSYDYRSVKDENSATDPDKTRTHQYQYDGWQQCARVANPFITQQFAQIDADQSLSKEEKAAKKNARWENNSQRDTFDASGLKLTTNNTLSHQRINYYDENRHLVLSIDARGAATQLIYNAFNQKITQRRYVTLIDKNDLETLTGGFINDAVRQLLIPNDADVIEQTTYDLRGQKSSAIDGESFETTYRYNAFGQLDTQIKPLEDKEPSLTVHYDYNLRGQCIQTTRENNDLSTVTQKTYANLHGKLTQATDANGNTTTYTHDRVGNQTSTTDANTVTVDKKTHDAFSRVLTKTDAFNQTTTYQYNQQEKSCLITPPITSTTSTTTLNAFGQKIKQVDALDNTQTWQHAPDGQVVLWVDPIGRKTQHQFNTESAATLVTDPLGIKTVLRYNECEVLNQSIDDSDGLKLTTTYGLDALNRRHTITNPRGFIVQQNFDRRSLCIKTVADYGADDKPGLRLIKQHTYNGQRTRTLTTHGDTQVANQYTVQFDQDGLNRSTGKTVDPTTNEFTTALALTQTHQLDANGSMIASLDPKKYNRRHFYDACNNHRFKVDADGSVTEWQYDDMHRMHSCCHYSACIDPDDLSDNTTIEELEKLLYPNHEDNILYTFYDENNRKRFEVRLWHATATATPKGLVTETRYDDCSREHIKINYYKTIDATDINTLSYTALVKTMSSKRSGNDRVIYQVRDDAGQSRFQFDPQGGVTEQVFDARGRIITRTAYATLVNPNDYINKSADTISIPTNEDDRTTDTVYDVFNKPIFLVDPEGAVTKYQHDNQGNLIYRCQFALPITPANTYTDLVTQLDKLMPDADSGDRITQYTFDSVDRKESITDATGNQDIFKHDATDNLIEHTDRNRQTWTMTYDRGKRLILKSSPNTTVTTVSASDDHQQLTAAQASRVVSTFHEYDDNNNATKIIHDYGHDERSIILTYNARNKLSQSKIVSVNVDDFSKAASFSNFPTQTTDATTARVYNVCNQEVCRQLLNGTWKFNIYDRAQRLIYTVQSGDGAVLGYQRNPFGEVVKQTRYATPLDIKFSDYKDTGIPLSLLEFNLKTSPLDRHRTLTRNQVGDVLTQMQDAVFYYYPDSTEERYGTAAPMTHYSYNAFRERIFLRKIRFPNQSALDYTKRQWFNKKRSIISGHRIITSLCR